MQAKLLVVVTLRSLCNPPHASRYLSCIHGCTLWQPPVVSVPHLFLCTAGRHTLQFIIQLPMHCCLWLLFTAHASFRSDYARVVLQPHDAATHQPSHDSVICFGETESEVTQQYRLAGTTRGAVRATVFMVSLVGSNISAVFLLCLGCT
jgi:hypothetical protein